MEACKTILKAFRPVILKTQAFQAQYVSNDAHLAFKSICLLTNRSQNIAFTASDNNIATQ